MSRRTGHPLTPRQTLTDLAYQRIKDDILSGNFEPGEPVSTGQLAQNLQISAMPIRSALTRLEAEGLVTIAPQRGVTVSRISPDELHENSIVRSRLEALAAHLACHNVSKNDIAALQRILQDLRDHAKANDPKKWVKSNAHFHELILKWSRNRTLIRLVMELRHQGMRGRMVTGHVPGHMDRRNTEHAKIIDALASRDTESVESIMREHILAAGTELVGYVRGTTTESVM
jgi:DNA-binding GntR family transcriptional regulator